MSIVVAVVSLLLIRGTPESKAERTVRGSFDWTSVVAFVVAMVSLNILIGQASTVGWLSPTVLILAAIFIVAIILFFRIEIGKPNAFVDLTLFRNTTFTGATLSNFLLNGAAGTLLVVLTLVQEAAGLSSLQSGLLTVGYLVGVLATIRVGEKLLQKMGPRRPMLFGCWITGAGILLTTLTFLLLAQYLVIATIGFTLFGIGLGLYATPSTDAALSNVPPENAGSASGLYKMASSLGAALGVAISAAIFAGLTHTQGFAPFADLALGRTDNLVIRFAASMALMFNVAMVAVAIVAIMATVPEHAT
jgi:DHA2 family multidrug resistance protein-like MFS transporter